MDTILRWVRRLAITATVLLLVVVVGGGAYYASQLLPAPGPAPITYDVEVTGVTDTSITLDATDSEWPFEIADVTTEGTFGFLHDDGYARFTSPVSDATDVSATRGLEVLTGVAPTTGTRGTTEASAFPEDPTVLGLEVREVVVDCPLGSCPAWEFPGPDDTWVVFVHGRGATRAEALRGVQIVSALGHPALVTSYRSDGVAPDSPDGYGHFGDTEWEDLDAAVAYARGQGAERIVLFGHSLGGSVVASWYRRAEDTSDVAGLILDSPLLSMHRTLVLQAEERNIPGPLIAPMLTVTKAIGDIVAGIDFATLEHVAAADELDVPTLVFHGRGDVDVPFGPSEDLAEARPDTVELVAYDGRHVRGWNVVNDVYVDAVSDFLSSVS